MFSIAHLSLIALTAITVPLLSKYIIHGGSDKVESTLKFLAIAILFFDPAYWIWEWVHFGHFDIETTFPFYICSLFWILMPIAIFAKEGVLKRSALANISTVGLMSGILGFVLNTHVGVYPILSFVPMRSLLYHYIMIFVPVLTWKSGYYKPAAGDQKLAFIPVLLILIPGIIMNLLYGFDYGYTGGGQGTPLTLLSDWMPRPLFLLVIYSGLYFLMGILFYRKAPINQSISVQDRGH